MSLPIVHSLLRAHYGCHYNSLSATPPELTAEDIARAEAVLSAPFSVDIAAFQPQDVVLLLRAWEETGRGEFQAKAKAILQAFCDLPNWRYPHHQHMDQVELGMATLTARLGEVWAGMGSRLPEQRQRLAQEIIARGLEPFYQQVTDPDRPGWARMVMNWRGYICADMGCAALALRDAYPRWRDCVAEAIKGCMAVADAGGEDGGWEEGIGYWGMCFGQIASFAEDLRQESGGKVDLFSHPYFRVAGDFGLYCFMPGGNAVYAFSDWRVPAPRSDLMAVLARENNNPHYQWCAELAAPAWAGIPVPRAVEPCAPQSLPSSKHFRGIDVAMLRAGWGEDDVAVGLKCGPRRVQIHQHLDANSFVIYAGESPIVDELECSSADAHSLYSLLGLQGDSASRDGEWGAAATVVHNTLLFDGHGQLAGKTEWGPWIPGARGKEDEWRNGELIPRDLGARIEGFGQSRDLSYAIGEAALAYPPPTESFRRAVVLLPPDRVIVADRLLPGADTTVVSLLHVAGQARQVAAETVEITHGRRQARLRVVGAGTGAPNVRVLPWELESGEKRWVVVAKEAARPPFAWLIQSFLIGDQAKGHGGVAVREAAMDRLLLRPQGMNRDVEITAGEGPEVRLRRR